MRMRVGKDNICFTLATRGTAGVASLNLNERTCALFDKMLRNRL